MKLQYTKILLFSLSLSIFVTTSPNVHKKNKEYITSRHTPTTTSRVLSACDIQTSIYDNDPEMRSVKEYFDRQTSQRFEERNERMKDKRQKCKEQCDKDIQEIIVKDKIGKSLAERVEKGCLMCACGLGGGVAPVWGLVSGLWYATWINYTNTTLVKIATDKGIAEGLKVGLTKATEIATQILKDSTKVPSIDVLKNITADVFTENITLLDIFKHIGSNMYDTLDAKGYSQYCFTLESIAKPTTIRSFYSQQAAAVTNAVSDAKKLVLADAAPTTNALTTAIIASVIAIVVIALVMIIIYLILRYRRKKKMKKKQQYTKLLKE
ncbi:PIR protein, putative [Plasmodium sp.]|nr:PIR protein, putative [Plasmodium sp.]